MTEAAADQEPQGRAAPRPTDSVTRGFLFADLRGYTSFVERHGAVAAADLLLRFRHLVRTEIDSFAGTEIRTEGDSFYVVFDSVNAAVRCGLGLVAAAATSADTPGAAIRVGVGIHAGETVETADGYVGSPVNIAARLCALARPGEVLVSDTVRSLTRTLLPVRFVPRGRQRLKGVMEPVAVFAVQVADDLAGDADRTRWRTWPRRRLLRTVGIASLAVPVLLALGVLAWNLSRPAALPTDSVRIGLVLPITGRFADAVRPLAMAAQLAVDDANGGGGVAGARVVLDTRDNGVADGEDPAAAAGLATYFAGQPGTVAMVGPLLSVVAEAQIPITNEAGLLQCSPTNTDPRLTKPDAGAAALRPNPARINYIRLAAAADVEARAAASFAYHDLGARNALVIDDTDLGRPIADAFQEAFRTLDGQVERRALNPGADAATLLDPLGSWPPAEALVFFGGFVDSGAPELRRAMVSEGYRDVPFLGWDGVFAGTPRGESFVDVTGDAAVGSYASRPSAGGAVRSGFEERYRSAYETIPAGPFAEFAPAAHACVEIVVQSLQEVAKARPSSESLREAVRAYAVDPAHRYDTVLGSVGFDENGDSVQQLVSFYRADPLAPAATGGWVLVKQQDFGLAP